MIKSNLVIFHGVVDVVNNSPLVYKSVTSYTVLEEIICEDRDLSFEIINIRNEIISNNNNIRTCNFIIISNDSIYKKHLINNQNKK